MKKIKQFCKRYQDEIEAIAFTLMGFGCGFIGFCLLNKANTSKNDEKKVLIVDPKKIDIPEEKIPKKTFLFGGKVDVDWWYDDGLAFAEFDDIPISSMGEFGSEILKLVDDEEDKEYQKLLHEVLSPDSKCYITICAESSKKTDI